jgi:hypothetical protein
LVALLLVVVWLVALTPIAIRKFGERSDGAYVERFRGRTRAMSRVTPVCARESAVATGTESTLSDAAARRARQQQAQWRRGRNQIERRRRTLAALLGGFFFTLALGLIPALHALLYVALAFAVFCAAYITLLVQYAQRSPNAPRAADDLTNVVPIRPDMADAPYLASAPMRPAFVVVDVRASR